MIKYIFTAIIVLILGISPPSTAQVSYGKRAERMARKDEKRQNKEYRRKEKRKEGRKDKKAMKKELKEESEDDKQRKHRIRESLNK